jgi:hypothetical protein
MITVTKQEQVQYGETPKFYREYSGKSTDTPKPTTDVANGSYFLEMDTGDVYAYDEEDEAWLKIAALGGSGS